MSPKKQDKKVDFSQYSNEELFEYFREALFENNFDFAEKCVSELVRRIEENKVTSEAEIVKYYKAMGVFQEKVNNTEIALEYFRKVLENRPDDEEALEHLHKLTGWEST